MYIHTYKIYPRKKRDKKVCWKSIEADEKVYLDIFYLYTRTPERQVDYLLRYNQSLNLPPPPFFPTVDQLIVKPGLKKNKKIKKIRPMDGTDLCPGSGRTMRRRVTKIDVMDAAVLHWYVQNVILRTRDNRGLFISLLRKKAKSKASSAHLYVFTSSRLKTSKGPYDKSGYAWILFFAQLEVLKEDLGKTGYPTIYVRDCGERQGHSAKSPKDIWNYAKKMGCKIIYFRISNTSVDELVEARCGEMRAWSVTVSRRESRFEG